MNVRHRLLKLENSIRTLWALHMGGGGVKTVATPMKRFANCKYYYTSNIDRISLNENRKEAIRNSDFCLQGHSLIDYFQNENQWN